MDENAEVVELHTVEEYVARVAALDVAKASAVVCTRLSAASGSGRRVQQTWTVKSTTNAVLQLAERLVADQVELVVMESTGQYWKTWFFLLEAAGLKVWLVNARDVRNVPGRPKTDKLDAVWLAKLAERGMLRASFIPPKPVRQLRDLTRTCTTLTRDRSKYRNRIQDVLETAGMKIADKKEGATNLFGVSGRAMLDALVAGERDPRTLAELARGKLRKKIPFLVQALTGGFEDHHGDQIARLLRLHDALTAEIDDLDRLIQSAVSDLDPTPGPDPEHPDRKPLLDRLCEIPGVGPDTAAVIISEVGVDMTVFPSRGHLASWAKLTPRTVQSGAKNTHGPTGKGNPWLKGALGQAAVTAGRSGTFLGARHRRLIKHKPKKKALVATARNILEIAWILIADPDARFADLGPDWHDRHTDQARRTRQQIRDLERQGYTVTPAAAAA